MDTSKDNLHSSAKGRTLTPLEFALGMERRRSEMRQLGALLLILGVGAAHSALHLTAILVEGMSGAKQVQGFRLPALCATMIQTGLGMVAMAMGFYIMLNSPTSKRAHLMAKALVLIVNLGPISFFITVVRLIQGANQPPEENEFIPMKLEPTQNDIKFVIAMGVLSLVSVCGTLIGGLTVVGLNLCAHLGGQSLDKHRGYYTIRLAYYSLLVFLGGISQLALGLYLGMNFGWGPYDDAVHVSVYTVFFPCLAVVVGATQTAYAVFGWCRALGIIPIRSRHDSSFLTATLVCWMVTMAIQISVQPSYGSGDSFSAEGATYAAVYLGFFIMPAWLDWLVRMTPSKIDPAHYSLPAETKCKEDFLCKIFGLTEGCKAHCACDLQPSSFDHPNNVETHETNHLEISRLAMSSTSADSDHFGRPMRHHSTPARVAGTDAQIFPSV